MENVTFENLVKEKFNSLSPGQKKVAEYLIPNLEEAAFSTVVQIGRKVDVSETTVIRLSYALGFSGFSEMQEKIQQQFLKNSQKPQMVHSLNEVTDVADEKELFARAVENHIKCMRENLYQLNVEDLWKVVDTMINADRVLIVGSRASYAAGYLFSLFLGTLRENVDLYPLSGDVYEKMASLTVNSVVLVISVPRYAKESLYIAECAKKQGIPLVAVTDRILSPIGRIADIVLASKDSDSIVPLISLLELIITGIQSKHKDKTYVRQQKLEQIYSNFAVFVE